MTPRLAMPSSRSFRTTGAALLVASIVVGAVSLPSAAFATPVPAPATSLPAGFTSSVVANAPTGQSSPDDITRLGDNLFVAYQNGVGSDGAAAPSGATQSTVVEYTLGGKQLASWTVTGKVDGMGADADGKRVILSVNEDSNSSILIIKPSNAAAEQLKHYQFDKGLTHGGGTDSVVAYNGKIYITASAPAADTTGGSTYSKPALYTAEFTDGAAGKDGVAALTPVFNDNVKATDLVKGGAAAALNLNDPDSSEKVPRSSRTSAASCCWTARPTSSSSSATAPARTPRRCSTCPPSSMTPPSPRRRPARSTWWTRPTRRSSRSPARSPRARPSPPCPRTPTPWRAR